jgi:hypothetical protein
MSSISRQPQLQLGGAPPDEPAWLRDVPTDGEDPAAPRPPVDPVAVEARRRARAEQIIRALNQAGYDGPLSVEWSDASMDREHGVEEACKFVKRLDFPTSEPDASGVSCQRIRHSGV